MNDRETYEAMQLLNQICQAIVDTVVETPHGAPCGAVYAALMTLWPEMTALQFNMLISGLEATGKLQRRGHCLYPPSDHGATELRCYT